MQNKKLAWFAFTVLLISMFCLHVKPALSAWGDYTILCGITSSGSPVKCNIGEKECIVCLVKAIDPNKGKTGIGRFIRRIGTVFYQKETNVYHCIDYGSSYSRYEGSCQPSIKGGTKGESKTRVLAWEVEREEGHECIPQNFHSIYTSSCVSCDIVATLSTAFVKAGAKAFDVSKQAANAVLLVGLIIWIGLYILKNIASFSTVEPRQLIQGLMIQLFKVYIAFVIINTSIATILSYTLEPIVTAGTDIATTILSNSGIDKQMSYEMQQEEAKKND
ncbi:MAG: hypothetical protein IJW75_06230 [Alphaproteobacteria bacterium]|nr:hypothetical protein [Alphaproteobacteria bacterium]